MIFHGNRLLADDSHEISYFIFLLKLRKMSQNLSSAAVVIGALRVKFTSRIDLYKWHQLLRMKSNVVNPFLP